MSPEPKKDPTPAASPVDGGGETGEARWADGGSVSCSFCGAGQDNRALMFAGPPRVAICDDCVGLCVRIVFEKVAKAHEDKEDEQREGQAQEAEAKEAERGGCVAPVHGVPDAAERVSRPEVAPPGLTTEEAEEVSARAIYDRVVPAAARHWLQLRPEERLTFVLFRRFAHSEGAQSAKAKGARVEAFLRQHLGALGCALSRAGACKLHGHDTDIFVAAHNELYALAAELAKDGGTK